MNKRVNVFTLFLFQFVKFANNAYGLEQKYYLLKTLTPLFIRVNSLLREKSELYFAAGLNTNIPND